MLKRIEEDSKRKQKKKEDGDFEGLQVIGCGFGRTGTTSLKFALDSLGFSCYHGFEIIINGFVDVPFWSQACDQKKEGVDIDFDLVFDGSKNQTKRTWNATLDWPTAYFSKELLFKYPNAKVILTTRDSNSWYNSLYNTVFWVEYLSPLQKLRFQFWDFSKMNKKIIWDGTFDGKFTDKEYATSVFEEHIEEIKRVVPEDRLLIFHPNDGWEPLCKFLGKDTPESEFPKGNSAEEFRAINWKGWREDMTRMAVGVIGILLLCFCVIFGF
mmetsp:Transcript_17811/g.24736  ORF Transcript_17811/g.24736 Transcript_17811/m.24736 type:complete len:269 (+) Transcript_17811:96-902(+)